VGALSSDELLPLSAELVLAVVGREPRGGPA
jgi:hypothetical protein